MQKHVLVNLLRYAQCVGLKPGKETPYTSASLRLEEESACLW
jgi:hypothetical protein